MKRAASLSFGDPHEPPATRRASPPHPSAQRAPVDRASVRRALARRVAAPRALGLACCVAIAGGASGCLAPDAVPGDGDGGGGSGGHGSGPGAGELVWAQSYGIDGGDDQRAGSVATSVNGEVIVAGDFAGSLTIGALAPIP